ncbi:MAG: PD-(D/E)XK nuclease family protein [Chroococcidiopsidaceae cyanobacterium CP_BM_ER_R8_30]|nr:PD-(D/E)XK nuclease family protein [Chroococcidiopsidaceae cyanobacterium CP_BM_ER_R8_30]
MAYPLSATKLQLYHRCPQAYYFRYELGLKAASFFGSTAMGTALHQTLAQFYQNWHYLEPLPQLKWIHQCWQQHSHHLNPSQMDEGKEILTNYYFRFIASQTVLRRPLAVEGKIQAQIRAANLEFSITGRYDRLDYMEDGIELIDYKSNRQLDSPKLEDIDLQIGLYYLGLEQRYHQSLRRLSLLYLRTGDKLVYDANPKQKRLARAAISELAVRLRTDEEWEPNPGEHCQQCAYKRYCPAVTSHPESPPIGVKRERQMQLTLSL